MPFTYYIHPQETWTEKECAKRAKHIFIDGLGTAGGPRGLISNSDSSYPSYGQKKRYNGGCIRNGKWYDGEEVPLPKIPDRFRISSWGIAIEKVG